MASTITNKTGGLSRLFVRGESRSSPKHPSFSLDGGREFYRIAHTLRTYDMIRETSISFWLSC
jgi:hypothetical protein